jgi:hypothetical protein
MHITTLAHLKDTTSMDLFVATLAIFVENVIQCGLDYEVYLVAVGDRIAIKHHTKRKLILDFYRFFAYLAGTILAGLNCFDQAVTHRRLGGGGADASWSTSDTAACIYAVSFVFYYVIQFVKQAAGHYMSNSGHEEDIRLTYVPQNIDFMIHRYNEWIMLMIGEAVLSLLIVDVSETWDYYKITIFGVLAIVILELLIYETQPDHHYHHALFMSRYQAIKYQSSIPIITIGLITVRTR